MGTIHFSPYVLYTLFAISNTKIRISYNKLNSKMLYKFNGHEVRSILKIVAKRRIKLNNKTNCQFDSSVVSPIGFPASK